MYLDEHLYFGLLGLAATAVLVLWARLRHARARIKAIADAEDDARRMLSEAQQEASSMMDRARANSAILQRQGEQAIERLTSDAQQMCLDMQKEAQRQADQLTAKASQDGNAIIQAAEVEAADRVEIVTREVATLKVQKEELRNDYRTKKQRYDELVSAVAIFDEEVEMADFGFYKSHFDFDTSEKFKEEIREVKDLQKEMMRDKTAIVCHATWYIDDNRRKGETMTNRAIRLTARAFNNECDAAVANVRWNNVTRLEMRIQNAFDAINRANESNRITITDEYLDLKLQELRLTHEYREKQHEEREHKVEIRRQEREEAKLRKDAADAAREAAKYAKLLEKAHREALTATETRMDTLGREIEKLNRSLAEARTKNERAMSMAEQTRSGYVYVISNIGSFGDHVYKIGMTRRLEPMDRIRELSRASVPFPYDTHAMIYSEDAPGMEAALHQVFADRRVNRVNNRKEFFRISLPEVKEEVFRLFPKADFVEGIEARDFRETKSLEERLNNVQSKNDARHRFPEELD